MATALDTTTDELHCVLCCEDIEFSACGPCDHSICLKCCLKLRMLRKEHDCPVCRAPVKEVIVSKGYKRWADKTTKPRSQHPRNFGIYHEEEESQQKVGELLAHKCAECDQVFKTFPLVKDHVRKVHSRYYCDICLRHLKIFTHERKCYTREELVKHRKHGDADDRSHRGHPLCQFCDDRYLDNDELLLHLRKNHFWCHLCEKDGRQDYFPGYDHLREHFLEQHFLCIEGDCVHEKFTSVFRTKIDFQAHKAQRHANKLSKAEARQNRQLDIDITFTPRQTDVISSRDYSFPEQRNGYGGRRTGGRERNMGGTSGFGGNDKPVRYQGKDRDNERVPRNVMDKRRRDKESDMLERGDNARDIGRTSRNNPKENRDKRDPEGTSKSNAQGRRDRERASRDNPQDTKDGGGISKNTQNDRKENRNSENVSKEEDQVKKSKNICKNGDLENVKISNSSSLGARKKEFSSSENIKNVRSVPLPEQPTTFSTGTQNSVPPVVGKSDVNASQKSQVTMTFHDDFPTLLASQPAPVKPRSPGNQTVDVSVNYGAKNRTTKFQDDFPALSATQPVNPSPTAANYGAQHSKPKKDTVVPTVNPLPKRSYHEEFPTLSALSNGNEKPNSAMKRPPGLTRPVQPLRPPPGLTWNAPPSIASRAPPDSGHSAGKDTQLIEQIHRLLKHRGESFVAFKTISGQFRNGLMAAESYYDECCKLLGNENIHKVFVKLIDILPDEEKQKELLTVYNDAKVRAKQDAPKVAGDSWGSNNVASVPPMSQCEDFPALSKSSGKKPIKLQQNKPGAWVCGK